MTTAGFDPAAYKVQVAKQINCECGFVARGESEEEVIERIRDHMRSDHPELLDKVSDEHRWGPTLEEWLGPATELMLDLAHVSEGDRVLDVAAGAGGQTAAAARRVGQPGSVLATDISERILAFADQAARDAGLANVATRVMDGERLDVEPDFFDAVISRVGFIYFGWRDPPPRIATRPGARAAGRFSLGAPGVIEAAYERAGFTEVEVQRVSAPLRLPSAADCVRFERESFGALHQMLSGLDESAREDAWAEIEAELSQFETASGFEAPCELLVAAGTAP